MSESQSTERLVIRPSPSHYKRTLKATPAFLLVFVGIMVLRGGLPNLMAAAVIAAVTLAAIALYMRRVTIVVTPTELTRVGVTGVSRTWPRVEVGGLLRVRLPVSVMDTREFDNLFVLDRTGRTMVRLKNSHWSEAAMARLTAALGHEPEGPDRPVTAVELAREYPYALPLYERRPWAFSLTAAAAIIGFFIVLGVAFGVANAD